jgi:hypothetical protein
MPTGYTASIKDGITFEEFALDCARAFGACVTMRDDPMSKPIPDSFEPSDYHTKALAQEKSNLTRLNSMTIAEAEVVAKAEYDREIKRIKKSLRESKDLMAKYSNMLRQVEAWQPPTSEHFEMKKFMMEQITSSMEHDDMTEYYTEHPPKLLNGEEWLKETIATTTRSIQYHKDEHTKEVERAKSRSGWVKALRNSLICDKFGTEICDKCEKRFRCFTVINYKT